MKPRTMSPGNIHWDSFCLLSWTKKTKKKRVGLQPNFRHHNSIDRSAMLQQLSFLGKSNDKFFKSQSRFLITFVTIMTKLEAFSFQPAHQKLEANDEIVLGKSLSFFWQTLEWKYYCFIPIYVSKKFNWMTALPKNSSLVQACWIKYFRLPVPHGSPLQTSR